MFKQRIAAGLIMATAVTTLTAASAFAADQPAVEAEKRAAFTIKLNDGAKPDEGQNYDRKTDENGDPYFETEDGIRVTISQHETDGAGGNTAFDFALAGARDDADIKKLEPKTDENGNPYFEMEDGSRVYMTLPASAEVE